MKKCLPILVLFGAALCVAIGSTEYAGAPPAHPDNCFGGFVIDYSTGDSLSGVTVRLYPPVGFTELTRTNENGEYWFCRPYGAWDSGWYTITTCCCSESRYREGDGNIIVDFMVPCQCQ